MRGTLYLVATPIGNLGDFSPRAVETLENMDFIAAEDTRVSVKLLNLLVLKHQEPEFITAEPAQLVTALVQNLKPVYAQSHIKLQCQCAPGTCRMESDLVRCVLEKPWTPEATSM